MSKVVQAIFWVAGVLMLVVVALPAAVGYGYAVIMFPAYDQSSSCQGRKADPIREDDYRVYLLNRGCNVQEAMEGLGKENQMAPARLMAFYRGKALPVGAETGAWEDVQAQLSEFKAFSIARDGLSEFWDDPISRLFALAGQKYFEVAAPIFFGAIGDGASHIAGIVQLGPLAQGLLYIGVSMLGLAIVASALYCLLKQALKWF